MLLLDATFSDRVFGGGIGRLYGAYRAVEVVTVRTGPETAAVR